jgi:lipopolysaccharide export system protein LptA
MKKAVFLIVLVVSCIPFLAARDSSITFSADRMSGTAGKKNGTTALEGKAMVDIGSLRITGDRIELSGKDFRFVRATGSVSGVDTEKGFAFSADTLDYDRESEVALFQGNAQLTDSKNDVQASAGILSYNQKTEVAFFQIGVKLKRKEITCTSDFATYRRTVSLLDLSGTPVVTRSGDEFHADRISVNLDTEAITLDGSVSGKIQDTKKVDDTKTPPPAPGTGDASPVTPASGDPAKPTADTPSSTPAASGTGASSAVPAPGTASADSKDTTQ